MINILSLGAGVQSSTLVYLSHAGKIPAYDKVIFADTGDEPEKVYQHLEYLKTLVTIEVIRKTDRSLSDHIFDPDSKFFSLPLYVLEGGKRSILKRQCTNDFKVRPIDSTIRNWLMSEGKAARNVRGEVRVKKGVRVNVHLGISLDESIRKAPARVQWKSHQYPLIELGMTRHDCIQFCIKHGYKIPPKSSCVYCPYHTAEYWATLTQAELDFVFVLDEHVRSDEFRRKVHITGDLYFHKSCMPLRDLAATGALFETRPAESVQLSFAGELLDMVCTSDGGFSCFS